MTSNGMSRHGSNGLGSVVATIGLFIVVDMGAAVDRSWTASPPVGAGGMPCQPTVPTTTTAAVSAPSPPISRTLVNTTPPALGGPLPGVYKSAPRRHSQTRTCSNPGHL
ncbi:Uncharacterised protein [Mycobacterium tuberculosis]|uniref:Uncharacterized protein n=2 Tax=Mycobacterium tuberculosis TaxID=1773 RepID=A0A655JQP1_MYCTX|nr:Uncharacterised protein [Mycobacterium tuberculosis]CKS06973.1 Uncharacterised protein [Mycobacterium tuberculosis]CKS76372.1 Uncharacterised protein [Mycobacterium tuberculosis]CKW50068.1 Uncharacterised protein [Mycobacterium tuberculosis]CNL88175.1 Uncharacterised protein [Mycobacterium tuberculosis]